MRLALTLAAALALASAPGCSSPSGTDVDAALTDASTRDAGMACTSDAQCDDGVFCDGTEACVTGRCTTTPRACDDGVACTLDTCSESLHQCVSRPPDADADGFGDASCVDALGVALGTDCDDRHATVFPGNTEVCDTADVDEDCDPRTFGPRDGDGDGEPDARCCNVAADGTRNCGTDCDDTRSSVSPSASEVCDGRDNDCDVLVDEGVTMTFLRDADHDGHGNPADARTDLCGPTADYPTPVGDDCDDTNPQRFPGAREVCNGMDDDCSSGGGAAPEEDADGDGHTAATYTGCEATPSSLQRDDCDDTNARFHPGAPPQHEPSCSSFEPCTSRSTGLWVCGARGTTGTTCAAEIGDPPNPTWDYDCSGTAERETPPADPRCGGGCGVAAHCTACAAWASGTGFPVCVSEWPMGTEFLESPSGAGCGALVRYVRCGGGACPSTCTSTAVMLPLACR